jgi:hypothetical protein
MSKDWAGYLNQLIKHLRFHLFSKEEPSLPTIFVIGAPRSGTTLTGQILTEDRTLARITNFVAAFWEEPAVGAIIEKLFETQIYQSDHNFKSTYGRTQGLANAHEFGYFWNRWFDFGQETHKLSDKELKKVDTKGLITSLANLEAVYQKPIVFKNSTWCTLQANFLAQVLPHSIFVACRRDPLYVAQSIFLGRQRINHNENIWWSIKPSNYSEIKNFSLMEQVAAQAIYMEKEMNEALSQVPNDRIIEARYEEVTTDPNNLLKAVQAKCCELGAKISPLKSLGPFESTNQRVLKDDQEWRSLCEAVDKFKHLLDN